jgi:hypothetical protein
MNESMHAAPAAERSRRELARTRAMTEPTAARGGDDVLETGVRR